MSYYSNITYRRGCAVIDISKFDINKLVDFVNLELQKNKSLSVNKFCDKYDIKKATLKTRMKRSGYSFNQNDEDTNTPNDFVNYRISLFL